MHKLLEQLVAEMVEKGIHYEDAQREFDGGSSRKWCTSATATCGKAADTLGVHRNTLTRKIKDTEDQGAVATAA